MSFLCKHFFVALFSLDSVFRIQYHLLSTLGDTPWCSSQCATLLCHYITITIETGRFSKTKTPREERFCLYCKSKNILTVENEIHFVLGCPLYKEERRIFLEEIHKSFPTTASLNNLSMYKWLLIQEDYNTTKCLGMFCKKSFDIRTKFLSSPIIL